MSPYPTFVFYSYLNIHLCSYVKMKALHKKRVNGKTKRFCVWHDNGDYMFPFHLLGSV